MPFTPGGLWIPHTLNELSPATTAGDIIYFNGTDHVRLAIGTNGQVLQVNDAATAPGWETRELIAIAYNPLVTTTNIPAAVQEYGNNTLTRWRMSVSAYTQCRVGCNVFTAATNGGNLRIQYSTDNSSFSDFTGNASLTATGITYASWAAIPAGALSGGDLYFRIVTSDGNGTDDPATVQVVVGLR